MRVVHVNLVRPHDKPDPETLLRLWPTLADVAAAVRRAGADITVVQAFHRDAERIVDGVHYRFIAEPTLPGKTTGAMPWRIARAVRDCKPQVIHVNGLDFAWHTRMLCGIGAPVLVQDHANTPGVRRARRAWGLRRVAGVAFTDSAQADPFFANGSFPPGLAVFPVLETSTRLQPGDAARARAETGVHGDPAVLWVGRLDANKDPLTILDAIGLAARDLPGLQLWCCYHEGDLLPQLRARLAADPVLAARVHLLGKVPHERIEALCRTADFFMLGSHRESCGYALIEALACGATPIVSDIPAFRRLTGSGAIGALVPAGDTAAFSRALIDLARRPRADLRQRAIDHFERELSFDRLGARLCEIYATLTSAPR